MKRSIKLSLAMALTGLALLAFDGNASATTLCKANQTPCSSPYAVGTGIEMNLLAGTKFIRNHGPFPTICETAAITGVVGSAGGEATSPEITPKSLSLCGGCPVTMLKSGTFRTQGVEGTMNGSVRWAGFELTQDCAGNFHCIMAGEVSEGITLAGGAEAILKFENAAIPRISGVCAGPNGEKWTGELKVTAPSPLYVSLP